MPTRNATLGLLTALLLALAPGCNDGAALDDTDGAVDNDDADLCGVGDDEKVIALPKKADDDLGPPKVFNGTPDPAICMSDGQQRAVGALTFERTGWTNGCTATLIADNIALTAAHCLLDFQGQPLDPLRVRFVVGLSAILPDASFTVAEVHPHPAYQGGGDNDVGLLVLNQRASELGVNLVPIPANTADIAPLLGEWVQNVGYGGTETNPQNSLRWWTQLEELTDVQTGQFQVYGHGQSSVCFGDSGGPSLYLFGGDSLRVIGTVSWGDPSCVDFDYFARVDDNALFFEGRVGPLDPCAGIDNAGLCDGDVAIWCDGGRLRSECCADTGESCNVGMTGEARCGSVLDPCAGTGYDFPGTCEGDTAVWCENGEIRRRHCDRCGQGCGFVDDLYGNYCTDR